ncbi:MAG: hypothetical protein QOC64_2724 [Solirubrobacteraceae bacterium]|nr:hypothetical protein [Solirubrobacteraceae bacterium]
MVKHIRKILLGIAALAALALGGGALAQAGAPGTSHKPAAPPAARHDAQAGDADNVRSGDQSAPDATDRADGPEAGDTQDGLGDKADDPNETAGSEVPGDDGPGGHADEPSAPNADHEAQGPE